MRRLTFYFSVLALPLLLAACEKDSSPDTDWGESVPLGVSSLQAAGIEARPIVSRAVATTDYPTSKSVGFFVKADATNGYKAVDNRKGVYSSARKLWLPEAATPADSIWLNSHDADVAIYAPYDAAHTTAATLNLAACLRPADGSKDIWCKRFAANNQSKNLSVTLEHLYTRLAVVVSRDAAYTSDATLTAFALKGNEAYQTATYQPFEAAPYTYGTSTGLAPAVAAQTLNASTASATYDLLLIPATLTGDLTLTLTVDGKQMRVAVAKEKFASTKLEAGKQYNVNLKLKPGKLEVTSVTVENWDVLAEVSGGNADFVLQIPPIDLGLPFVIAPGNLTAAPNGSGGYIYSFAEDQGYYSGDGSDGDYYCWNTLYPNLDNETQTVWDDARDACRQVDGGEWYTPSIEQWRLIVGKGSVWGTYAAGSGTNNGYYIGTSSLPSEAERNKFLFLPAAGGRFGPGGWNATDNDRAYYWSSTVNASSGYSAAHAIFFTEAVISEETMVDGYYGFPLRCVKDKPVEPIDIGLDFLIAPGNLTATKQADGTSYSYAFAKGQGYYSNSSVGDDYFCWNTLEPDVNNVTQSSWNDERDPCRKVADGNWYTPTEPQLQALIDAGSVWGENIYTMPDGTTKNGRYFGTNTVPSKADQDKYVFLPAAGYISGSSYIAPGADGDYQCSDAASSSNGRYLAFNNKVLFVNSWAKRCRFTVRCVRDKV